MDALFFSYILSTYAICIVFGKALHLTGQNVAFLLKCGFNS